MSGSGPTISAPSHLLKTLDSNHLTTLPPAPHSAPKSVRGYFLRCSPLRRKAQAGSAVGLEVEYRDITADGLRSRTAQKPSVAKFKRGATDLFQLYPRRDPPLPHQESESRRSRERRLRRFAGEGEGAKRCKRLRRAAGFNRQRGPE